MKKYLQGARKNWIQFVTQNGFLKPTQIRDLRRLYLKKIKWWDIYIYIYIYIYMSHKFQSLLSHPDQNPRNHKFNA